jgi:hypothetical protein
MRPSCTTLSYTLWVEWYYLKINYLTLRSKVKVIWRSLRYATHCLMVSDFFFRFRFFSAQLVWTIIFLSFEIGQWYLVCGCMTIRQCVAYHNNQLFDLEVKGQGHTKVITICDTLPYGYAPTYQISLTYLERQKCYAPDKKILFKKQLFVIFGMWVHDHKVVYFRDRSMIFGMWVHDHKAVYHVP